MKALLLAAAVLLFVLPAVRAEAPGPVIGIGTELKSVEGQAVVAQIVTGSPAEQAGVRVGDRLVQVDGTKVDGMPLIQVAHLLRGARDSAIKLTVSRGGGLKRFAMKREILFLAGAPQPQL